jgi:transcriptional regulator
MPNEPRAGVLQGTLDLMVLQALATLGSMHGYAISARIEQVSNGAIQLNMGTLYPGLMRLEQRGFIRAEWDRTETNRRARYYSITAAGRRQLQAEKAEWERMTAIMQAMLEGDAG